MYPRLSDVLVVRTSRSGVGLLQQSASLVSYDLIIGLVVHTVPIPAMFEIHPFKGPLGRRHGWVSIVNL